VGQHAFEIDPDSVHKGGRTIDIVLMINNSYDANKDKTVRIETHVTGRNTSYGFPVSACPAPSSI
jgi:hypothetical protein